MPDDTGCVFSPSLRLVTIAVTMPQSAWPAVRVDAVQGRVLVTCHRGHQPTPAVMYRSLGETMARAGPVMEPPARPAALRSPNTRPC